MIVKTLHRPANISAGTAAADYIQRLDHDAVLIHSSLLSHIIAAERAKGIVSDRCMEEMEQRSSLRPDIEKPYIHLVIAYDPGDTVHTGQLRNDAKDLISRLVERENEHRALKNANRNCSPPTPTDAESMLMVAALHRDKEHPHLHLLVNRVDGHGNLWHGAQFLPIVKEWAREREREHDFRQLSSSYTRSDSPSDDRLPSADTELGRTRAWVEDVADNAVAEVPVDMPEAQRVAAVRERVNESLAAKGWSLTPGARGGWAATGPEGQRVKASRLGLGGHRSPDRLGKSDPKQEAREAMWAARARAKSIGEWKSMLAENGLNLDAKCRTVAVRPGPGGAAAAKYSVAEMGFRGLHSPAKTDWSRPVAQPRRTQGSGKAQVAAEPQAVWSRMLTLAAKTDRGRIRERAEVKKARIAGLGAKRPAMPVAAKAQPGNEQARLAADHAQVLRILAMAKTPPDKARRERNMAARGIREDVDREGRTWISRGGIRIPALGNGPGKGLSVERGDDEDRGPVRPVRGR